MSSVAATGFLPVVAAPAVARDSLVVSLHDVAPSTREVIQKMISDLCHEGMRICSLLVVPDYHHQGPIAQDRQFISWLRDLEAQGNEIVIHGYFHQRPRRARENLTDKFLTRFYTRGEGEFYDLDYEEALRRIRAARDQFQDAGLTPRGFIAPAWLLSPGAERAARDAEMEYTTRLRSVRDLRAGEDFPSWSLVYSVSSAWRRAASLGWNRLLPQLNRENPLLRISVHPADYSHPAIWQQIVDLVRKAGRMPTTYRDWIAEQRLAAIR